MGIIEDRRSIRKFKKENVSDTDIECIIRAGMVAPSPKNRQPWKFIILKDACQIKKIASMMENSIKVLLQEKKERNDIVMSLETIEVIRNAPVLILLVYEYGTVPIHDDGVHWPISAKDVEVVELQALGAAAQNMLLKAQELGIGSLWCADILYAYEVLKKYSDNPIVSAICLGYADEMPLCRPRKNFNEVCVYM